MILLAMAQGLHLAQRLALQQVLAPQLQQSLALLQAPVLELKALVAAELAQNPVLEEVQGTASDQEIELDCDYNLNYDYVIKAITAITGYVENGKRHKLIERIKFTPPKTSVEQRAGSGE